jgi:nucleotide-binding universal stress UspA family protein
MGKIAVCFDSSDPAHEAWRWALNSAIKPDDQVTLVAVAPSLDVMATTADPFDIEPMSVSKVFEENKMETERLEKQLKEVQHSAERPVDYVMLNSVKGAGPDLVDHINKEHYDQVIVGNRGLGAVSRTMLGMLGLGSVSEHVLHHSDTPVTIVKKKEPTKAA